MIKHLPGIVLPVVKVVGPVFQKRISIINRSIRRATVYIVGLGLYELYINGKKMVTRF